MARLKDKYVNEIIPAMVKKFDYKNVMQVPKLDKVVINVGLGDVKDDAKKVAQYVADEAKTLGGDINICEFLRFEKGEGIEKKEDDLADEVAKLAGLK